MDKITYVYHDYKSWLSDTIMINSCCPKVLSCLSFVPDVFFFFSYCCNCGWLLSFEVVGNPSWFSGKEFTCDAGDVCSVSAYRRPLGEGNCNLPQHSCLGNPMGRGTCQAIVHEVTRVGHNLATKQPQSSL